MHDIENERMSEFDAWMMAGDFPEADSEGEDGCEDSEAEKERMRVNRYGPDEDVEWDEESYADWWEEGEDEEDEEGTEEDYEDEDAYEDEENGLPVLKVRHDYTHVSHHSSWSNNRNYAS